MRIGARYVDDVVRYYDETWWDYRALWMNRANSSMHFGYWDETIRDHAGSIERMNAVVADLAGVEAGQLLLDAGCGVGGPAMWLAAERGCRVVGVTVSRAQAQQARQQAVARGLDDRCRFVQQDFLRLGLADEAFDIVWAQESVCHAPHKDAFLREAHRVLRPGGRVVCADFFRTQHAASALDERWLADWYAGWAIAGLATVEEFCAWTAATGFTDVTVHDLSDAVRPSLRRLHRLASVFLPAATVLRVVGARSAVQHANVRAARRQWQLFQRGLWRHAAVTAVKPTREPGAASKVSEEP